MSAGIRIEVDGFKYRMTRDGLEVLHHDTLEWEAPLDTEEGPSPMVLAIFNALEILEKAHFEAFAVVLAKCPDCGAALPGPYGTPGVSMARTRPNVLLCSACGTREALAQHFAHRVQS